MALVDLPGLMFWPNFEGEAAAPTFSSMLLDGNSEKAAAIVEVQKAGSIRKVHWRTGVVTTGETVDVRIETLDASGMPSGTLWGTTTNGSQVIADADDTTWFTTTLTADAAVVVGDKLAVVISFPASAVGNLNIMRIADVDDFPAVPYTSLFTGTWAKSLNKPCIALEYSDGTFSHIPGCYPCSAVSGAIAFSSASATDERGNKFRVPFSCRAVGAWYFGGAAATGGTARIKLYDDASTLLVQTPSVDHDYLASSGPKYLRFESPQVLAINTDYRLTLLPETTVDVVIYNFSVNSAAILDSFPGGQNMYSTRRANAGAFTDTATTRYMMGLMIDQLDDGAGGSGGAPIIGFGSPIIRAA